MRRLLSTLLLIMAATACDRGDTSEAPGEATPEAPANVSSTPAARPIRGLRAIDRARDASALAETRALQHDTIR